MPGLLPSSLARRFALAAAGLAAFALLVTFLASWWLIDRQHREQLAQLAARESEFHAAALSSELHALADRMAELAHSSIVEAALAFGAREKSYLSPFVAGIRHVNGVPVRVMVADSGGGEIAANATAPFEPDELAWLRGRLEAGARGSTIVPAADGISLLAVEPLIPRGGSTPHGALFYKVPLDRLRRDVPMRLEWGEPATAAATAAQAASPAIALRVPEIFTALQLRVHAPEPHQRAVGPAPEYQAMALLALLLFSVVAVGGASLAKVLTRDLRALEAFSSRFIGSRLNTERAPVGGSEEVASLARAINEMLDRLNEQHLALLRERQKLTEMAEALRAADRRKDEFLAMLAHELRNPLAPILAGSELMKRLPGLDARLANVGEVIGRQTRHMTRIVDDLLDVSRVTRGLVELDRARLDFRDVVAAAVDQVRPLIDARRHELSVEMPPCALEIVGDYARLVQVLSNLLNNAAKYTPEFGRIRLRVVTTSRELSFSVEDNGPGISPQLMPVLFDLFSQGSRGADRAQGGLGLGLALVRTLVQLHGGSVRAFSDSEGCGTAFIVRLPRPAIPIRSTSSQPPAEARAGSAVRMLVVDDNADVAHTLATLMQIDGHTVRVAYDGLAALEQARREPFDAFILDIGLPGMNGIELARTLRRMPATRDALMVAITGYGQPADRAQAIAAGFDEHLVKPIDTEALRSLLGHCSETRRYSKTA